MEVEKRGVKGGFFQLFDWNGKSRKKLFSSKSELPESSNQGKENYRGSAIIRRQQGSEKEFPPNGRGYDDYHYASSASGDSEYGTKAPGVVARLMGLDSLPVPNVNEPCLTPFIESNSFRDSSYLMPAPPFQNEHDIVIFESVRNKLDGSSRNPLGLRLQKMHRRHLDRFQTESLPPKSAKPISVTHHRLLSPIKSPGFIPPKNTDYIIEAASKIMEQSPRSTTKGHLPSIGSSSVPFRVRDLKQRMEASQGSYRSADASQKGKEQNSKNMKKQLDTRGKGRLADNSYQYKSSEESKSISSQRLKNREKSVSLAVQAKTNIQRKDGFTSVGNRSSEKQREHSDLTNTQKMVEKKNSSRRPSEVLRLNNQKQNCASAEDAENFGPSSSKLKERKESNLSTNYINGRANRTVNKIVIGDVATSRKTNFVAADPAKELPLSRPKTNSKKKLSIDGNIQSGGSVAHKAMMAKDEKSVKCNVAFEGDAEWDGIDKKSSLDVVSFTFTSPIKKSGASSSSCNTISEATNSCYSNSNPCTNGSDLGNAASYSSRFNVIGGDTLSVLLEQKLKELTSRIELSQKDLSEAGSCSSSANSYTNMAPISNLVRSLPMDNDVCNTKEEIQNASSCYPSTDNHLLKAEKENKGLEYIEGDGDDKSNIEYQRYLHLLGSFSTSSQLFSGASSDSFDVDRSSYNEGRLPSLSFESCEEMNRKPSPTEGDVELSDTASVGTVLSETVTSSLYMMGSRDSSNWEIQYIGDILSSAELFVEEFALGQAHKIIAPNIFDQLENQRMNSYKEFVEEEQMLERKVLFDCVCECLELRCGQLLNGSWKLWAKQMRMLGRTQFLADDLYREISGWRNVKELMMDELVDKDMSCKNGKWTDFETEAFEEGVEIEERILTCLVDELIDDFLL